MKRSILLEYSMLERLTAKPDYENVIIGTGALARDMRKKLLLLGLKAPFLVGDMAEPGQNIRHYNEIAALGDPKRYRFIICCDVDEWALMEPAQIAVNRFLGAIAGNHPQVVEFSSLLCHTEHAGKKIADAVTCNVYVESGLPYTVYGDKNGGGFHIHVTGSCNAGGVYNHTQRMPADILYELLYRAGFPCTLYAWGQPSSPIGDDIMRLVRDICFHKCDLLIYFSSLTAITPQNTTEKNALAVRTGLFSTKDYFIQCVQSGTEAVSNGVDHDIELPALRQAQQRIFGALSKQHGFSFWDAIIPDRDILLEKKAQMSGGQIPSRLSAQKERKNRLLAMLDKRYTKDYTGAFSQAADIYSLFADAVHFSGEGNRLIAKRIAEDILKEYKRP